MLGYRNPKSLNEALATLADLPDWRPVCGCTDVLVQLRAGRIKPAGFVNLWGLLPSQIVANGDRIHLGAGVTCSQLATSPLIREALRPLWEAARTMGSPLIRNRASLGGNIANASPAADMANALLADNAEVVIRGLASETIVPIDRVFLGPGKTVLKPGELIVEVLVPKPVQPSFARFDKLGFRQAQVISAVSLAMRVTGHGGGVEQARLSWGSVAPRPVRSHSVEDVLRGTALTSANIEAAVNALRMDISPIDDHRASARYRMLVAQSFLRRALKECQSCL